MNKLNIFKLIMLGEFTIELFQLEQYVKNRRHDYFEKIKEFENLNGEINGKLDPSNTAHAQVIAFTKVSFDEYRRAKRCVYNMKRRLDNAAKRVVG